MLSISPLFIIILSYVTKFRSVKVPVILSDSLHFLDFSGSSTGGVQAAVETVSETIHGNCGGSMSYSVSADGAKAKLTAIDNPNCSIEADVDGDDSYEWVSGTLIWDEI